MLQAPSGISPWAATSRKVWQWWRKNENCSRPYFCEHLTIYNCGRHLYVGNTLPPGSFISWPHVLTHLPFHSSQMGYDVGNLWVTHHGHGFGDTRKEALVTVSNRETQIRVLIPRWHTAYFAQNARTRKLFTIVVFQPLPSHILM